MTRRPPRQLRGFTLIELILVMGIIVIMSALVAPSLRGFGLSKECENTAREMVGLATYARSHAVSQGRVFRLYIDENSGTYWLAEQGEDGTFGPPTDDAGRTVSDVSDKRQVRSGILMDLTVQPQANTVTLLPPSVKQDNSAGNAPLDMPGRTPNQLVWNVHDTGTPYVEFQPSGRTDTAKIKITDNLGSSATAACDSATELFHLVNPNEMNPNGGAP